MFPTSLIALFCIITKRENIKTRSLLKPWELTIGLATNVIFSHLTTGVYSVLYAYNIGGKKKHYLAQR